VSTGFWWGILGETDYLDDLDVDGKFLNESKGNRVGGCELKDKYHSVVNTLMNFRV